MSTFRFSPCKKFLRLLVFQKFFIFTFGLSFKVNLYVEFIYLNEKRDFYNTSHISVQFY